MVDRAFAAVLPSFPHACLPAAVRDGGAAHVCAALCRSVDLFAYITTYVAVVKCEPLISLIFVMGCDPPRPFAPSHPHQSPPLNLPLEGEGRAARERGFCGELPSPTWGGDARSHHLPGDTPLASLRLPRPLWIPAFASMTGLGGEAVLFLGFVGNVGGGHAY